MRYKSIAYEMEIHRIGFATQKLIFTMLDVKLLLMQTFFINFADCSPAFQKHMLFTDNGYYDK